MTRGETRDDRDGTEPHTGPTTGSVARIVALLEAVARSDSSAGVRSLARDSGLDKSAVSRLLRQLTEVDVLEPSDVAGRYRIGPRFFSIAHAVARRDDLTRAARPLLQRLVDRFNETAYLALLEDNGVYFRDKVECNHPIRYVIDDRRPGAIHAGSGGRAILAGLTDEQFEALMATLTLEPLTSHTITDADEIRRKRREDQERGYSVSILERSVGGCGIAAPFSGWDGSCRGSLVLTMPHTRFDADRVPEWGEATAAASAELSARLGHVVPASAR